MEHQIIESHPRILVTARTTNWKKNKIELNTVQVVKERKGKQNNISPSLL